MTGFTSSAPSTKSPVMSANAPVIHQIETDLAPLRSVCRWEPVLTRSSQRIERRRHMAAENPKPTLVMPESSEAQQVAKPTKSVLDMFKSTRAPTISGVEKLQEA